ncbi:restriction endonuclease subunit S [Lactobacillus sp. A27]|uniref:restriction endonuclease subunit S n=1 Tax=Lactobacillus sp. A27 TaxID=2796363 RepID=UPI00191D8CA1|nr:restriction endonuclease subunit S [Lactobacillus sp. A27]MBL1059015.1 restriction endonuclease subunit S [Lactobacillus sp. A27]
MKTNTLDFDAQALRDKILDLAMRGKLVPQDPNDEPASVLLENNNLKSSDEKPHAVPKSWEWIVLGSGVKFINGRAYKKAELLEDKNLTPVLRVGNLFTNSSWYYSNLHLDPDKYIDNGDLIYAWSASFGPRIWDGEHVIYHYHIWKLILDQAIDKNYLYYFLLDKRNVIGETDLHGSTMKHITKTNMEHLSFPLPPLSEQSRIAAKIAQLFALLRKVETSTQQYAKLQTLLKSKVLDLAMRGKLVKQDPNDEPASELLKKIKAEKAELIKEKKIKKTKPLPPITDDEKPFDIPDSWEWVRLGDVLKPEIYRKPNVDFMYIDIASVNNKINKVTNPTKIIINKDKIASRARQVLSKNDILFSVVRPYLKNIAMVPNTKDVQVGSTGFYVLKPYNLLNRHYLFYLMLSKYVIQNMTNKMRGDNSPSIRKSDLQNLLIPLPPINEQLQIVNIIQNLNLIFNKVQE